jgi:chondroitin AC lyase
VRPTNAGYEYMLVPSATEQKVRALASNPGIEILSNTADLQAVRYPALHMVMATFYSAGQLANGATQIAVDSPCMVLVKDVAGKPNVQVSDPTHLLTTVRVTVNGVTRAVALPAAGDAGESVSWTAK